MKIALALLPLWVPGTPPLGIASIAAVLRREGHDVDVFDINQEAWLNFKNQDNHPWTDENMEIAENPIGFQKETFPQIKNILNKFVKKILASNYDVLGLSINQINIHSSRYVIHLIKKLAPDFPIMVGGPDVYEINKLILDDFISGHIDVGVISEGEESVIDALRILQGHPPLNPKGLLTPNNVRDKTFKAKRETINFANLPIPDFDGLDTHSYDLNSLPIMMSRGCVAACSFCTEFLTWRNYRVRTPEHVFEELSTQSEKYKLNSFFFSDSLINGNPVFLSQLFDLIIERKLDIKWQAYARADKNLTEDMVKRMALSGCTHLNIGFESGSNKVLKLMNKSNTAEEGERVSKLCQKYGIKIRGLFIIGFPGEDEDDIKKTISFIFRNLISFEKVYIGTGLGVTLTSPMGMRPKGFDLKLNDDGSVYLDKEGNWVSKDGSFTIKERNQRIDQVRNFLDVIDADWAPIPRGWKRKKTNSITRKFLNSYYFFKLNKFNIG